MDKNEKWNKNEDRNSYMFYTCFPVTDIKWDGASRNNKLLSTCLEETVFQKPYRPFSLQLKIMSKNLSLVRFEIPEPINTLYSLSS